MTSRAGSGWLLYTVWMTALVAVVLITFHCERESDSIQGIAETREIVVSSENPVEIRRINVVEGQSVTKDQLLLELVSPEQILKINHISHQLAQLKAQKGINKDEIRSKIKQLKAEKASLTSEVNNQIRQMENQYELNKELTSGLRSIRRDGSGAGPGSGNPVTLKIKSLRQEIALSLRPLNIQIELLQKSLNESASPIRIQVEQLEKELALLKAENRKLNIYAQISGIIGSVNFKSGEKVSPFAPILTLHAKNPSFVKGYVHENVYTRISLGKEVAITSQTDVRSHVTGTVVGVGARIVEYPVRLRKNPVLQTWGREVLVRIPEDNGFILGEKVVIASSEPRPSFLAYLKERNAPLVSYLENLLQPEETYAESRPEAAFENAALPTYEILPVTPLKTSRIEASALVWLKDMNHWLMVSDDTPKKNPMVFLMDRQGRITKEVVIKGLEKIDDMESATLGDDGVVYIASSLNADKKGKVGKSRRLLISVRREGDGFRLVRKADIHELLRKQAKRDRKKDWARFVIKAMDEHSLDMEGMSFRDAALYLGFKSPSDPEGSVILKIDRIEDMLREGKLRDGQVSLWKKIALDSDDASPRERVSDLFHHKGKLYVTGVSSKEETGGSLWKLDDETGKMLRLAGFEGLRPEGLAAGGDGTSLMVAFDQGKDKPSKIAIVRGAL